MVTGLNVGAAPHLIADHELAVDQGGWTDQDGTWRTAKGHLTVHAGSAISCMAVGRMKGQDHYVYMDGNTLKDLGSTVGTITMGSDPRIIPMDDKFLILGASDGRNRIYDGDHVRDHGPWNGDLRGTMGAGGMQTTGTPATYTVDAGAGGITQAAEAKVFLTGVGSLVVGQPVMLTGVVGMTEINGNVYTIQSIDVPGKWIEIDCNSTGFTAYSSAGTMYRQVCGLDGDYRYALTTTVELADGAILESNLIPVGRDSVQSGFVYNGTESETFTLTPTMAALFKLNIMSWILSSVAQYNITGTIGTDFKPGIRLYRTKEGGTTDFYLEHELQHGDTGLTYTTGAGYAYYSANIYSYKRDVDLGAVYTADIGDHAPPPTSSLAAQVGQRLFVNNADYPKRVYISHLDGTDYFNELGWFPLPDHITAMRRVRDRLVCSSAKRIWVVDMISGFPVVSEVDTSHGTVYPDAMFTSEHGLFFVKDGGIYFYDLNEVVKVSRKGILDAALSSGVAAAVSGEVAVFTTDDQGGTAMANVRDGAMVWHGDSLAYTHLAVNSTGSVIGCEPTKVDQLFASSTRAGSFTGKMFGDGLTYDLIKLYIDATIASGSSFTYQVTTNEGACFSGYQTATSDTSNRQIFKLALPRKACELWQLQVQANVDLQVHGYWFEVEA